MEERGGPTLPLLDYLAQRAGCANLSDLRWAGGARREEILRALEELRPEAAELRVWNDALDYLVQAPPEETAQAARARLIERLADAEGRPTGK